MYNPHIDKVQSMVNTIANKHVGEIDTLDLDWTVIEMYDKHGEVITQLVPLLNITFKG